ncbi:MAG: PP2C family protein-serine/threonine phosphatase, partial [Armatimonadota bacterium]
TGTCWAYSGIPLGSADVTLLALTNAYLLQTHAEAAMFATLFLGALDPGSGKLSYVNAGHCPPLVISAAGAVTSLDPVAPAVGMFPDTVFAVNEVCLAPGDTLLAFTDGLTEAQDADETLFGDDRLLALVGKPVASALALADDVAGALDAFVGSTEQSDDITLLIYHRETPA